MLEHLPAPGEFWAKEDRKRWLQMIELAFDIIYDEAEPPQGTDTPTMRQHGG